MERALHPMKLFKICISLIFLIYLITPVSAQNQSNESIIQALENRVKVLELTETVQSMTQRSLLTPGYQAELKALIACQAYHFWKQNTADKLVSHLNVYSALHYSNKYLKYDSSILDYSYNQILGHSEMVVSVELGTGSYFYSAGSDGRVLRWDINDPKAMPQTVFEGLDLIRSIDISSDERFLMIVTKNRGIIILDLNENALDEISEPLYDAEMVQAASFLPDKLAYLTVNRKGEIKLKGYKYDTTAIGQFTSKVLSIAINPADYQFYLGTAAGEINKLKESGEQSKIIFERAYAINAMDISDDYKMLAIGRELGDAVIWDLENHEAIRVISGHQSAVTDVEFSPDGKSLLTASRDGTARIWDINNTRKLPFVLDDHNDWVMTCAYNKQGSQIITGSKDNYIRIWQVDPSDLADRICELVQRNLTGEEWLEYVGENIPYQKTCPSIN
ncbi:MAG: WD40 repeat protein [Cyclobacteriaceae bacterium]